MSQYSYRVIAPPDLPLSQHAEYAQRGIAEAEAREAQRQAEADARRERDANLKAAHEQIAKENKERDERKAAAQRKREAEQFDAALRASFFEQNPSASESDWLRNSKAIRDEALRQRTLAGFEGRESMLKRNVEALRQSGRYRGL